MAKFVPTASIVKHGKGDYRIVTKKSFLAKNVEVEKHFKSVTKAYEWAYTHGFTNIEL
jgi:hypothetical protein